MGIYLSKGLFNSAELARLLKSEAGAMMMKIIYRVGLSILLTTACSVAFADDADSVAKQIQQLNTQIQSQLQQIQEHNQKDNKEFNTQIQAQFKQLQADTQAQMQKLNSQLLAEMKQLQTSTQAALQQLQKDMQAAKSSH